MGGKKEKRRKVKRKKKKGKHHNVKLQTVKKLFKKKSTHIHPKINTNAIMIIIIYIKSYI